MLAKPEATALARECLHTAERVGPSNVGEIVFLKTLAHLVGANFVEAARTIESAPRPTALHIKLGHQLRFMGGDTEGMLRSTGNFLAEHPFEEGASYIHGCHAFALEELGRFEEARRHGELALAQDPNDVWAGHAVVHTFEMQGLCLEGLNWLEQRVSNWENKNNFRYHVAWHRALFNVSLGRYSEVIRLYDEEIRAEKTDDFRDFANASSLLQRLEWAHVDVGDRWEELRNQAAQRATDGSLVFAILHRLLALRRSPNSLEAERSLCMLRSLAKTDHGQAEVVRLVGLPLAEAIVRAPSEQWSINLEDLSKMGGSNAQRDVFLIDLQYFAQDFALTSLAEQIEAIRRDQRPMQQVSVL